MSSRQIPVTFLTGFPILVERFLVLVNVGLLVALMLSIWPYLASAFYLYQGSNLLESAVKEQGLRSSDWEVITFTPLNLYSNGLEAKLDSSAGYLQRATRWDATNAEAYNTMAKAHYLQGDPLLALDALSRVDELRPANPLIHLTLGDIYDGLGLAEEAVAEYERSQMELKGTSVGERAEVNYLKLADAYLKAGDPNTALPVLQKIMTLDPDNPYALYYLAGILDTMGEGERLLAQGLYEQLQELQIPTWGDKRLYGYLPPDEAMVQFRISPAEEPDDADSLLALGEARYRDGDIQSAENLFERAVSMASSSWYDAYRLELQIGRFYREAGELVLAESWLVRAIDGYPDGAWAHGYLGLVYLAKSELMEGTREVSVAVELAPDSPTFRAWLGMVYVQRGLWDHAAAELSVSLALDPDQPWVRALLDEAGMQLRKMDKTMEGCEAE